MGLLRDLEENLVDHGVLLSATMQSAKVMAVRLGADQLHSWLDTELNGYRPESELPPYRKIAAQSIGAFVGTRQLRPYRKTTAKFIRTKHLNPHLRTYARTHEFTEGVRELESWIESDAKDLLFVVPWLPDVLAYIADNLYPGYKCLDAWKPIGRASVEQVLEAIRNRLLNLVLQVQKRLALLEALHPEADDEDKPPIPADQANQIFHACVYGNSNVVRAGSKVWQLVQQQIAPGDLEGLARVLRRAEVTDDEIHALTKAIQEDGTPAIFGSFGKRVAHWMGRMTEKAAAGEWKVALETALTLTTKALWAYYGWK